MTVDIPVESPQGNTLSCSIIEVSSEENCVEDVIPVVVLKKLRENDQYYVASPRTSSRARKIKHLDDFEMDLSVQNLASPKKRSRSKKMDGDIEMLSPSKVQKTPSKFSTREEYNEDSIGSLCLSLEDCVQLVTPVKRSLDKRDFSDIEASENVASPRKKGPQRETPGKNTPRTGRAKKAQNQTPTKPDENELVRSSRRQRSTPVKYREDDSPIRSVKINLNESFRTAILRSKHPEHVKSGDTPRVLRSRNSACYNTFDSSLDNETDPDTDYKPEKKTIKTRTPSRKTLSLRPRKDSTTSYTSESSEKSPERTNKARTPSRKTQNLRPRKDSTTSYTAESSERSPERRPPRTAKTPKTPRNRRATIATPKSVPVTPKTPRNRLKMLRDGVITPSMHSRSSIVPDQSTPLMKARTQLHVSYVPTSLPCREREYLDVYNFLRGKLDDGCGGCMYISGVPGTGKTATVTSVIDSLQHDKEVQKFSYVSVNGMRLTEPRQSYVEIWKQLTGKTVPWEHAQSLLEERFTKKKAFSPVVMLIDELDILCTKRQDVVYNLLDWPTKSKNQLIVITIANTMDLPERLLMSRVTSRLGLTRLTFQAYTHKQLMEIVTKRLTGTDSFNADAIQLVARKVASVSGDARRALDICRRAAEMAEEQGGEEQTVNIMHVNGALEAMITQPQVMAIRRCSRLQKLILQAVVAEVERTGVEETTFNDVFRMLVSCCALDGFKMVSSTVAQRALFELSAFRLIITDPKISDIYTRIILNVSVHDVYFAIKKE